MMNQAKGRGKRENTQPRTLAFVSPLILHYIWIKKVLPVDQSSNRFIQLREAHDGDKKNIYDWLFFADSSHLINELAGLSLETFPSREEFFLRDYLPYYFSGSNPELGRCYIIQFAEHESIDDIGTIQYSASHLNDGFVELDIWMKGNEYCGKRYGSTTIKLLLDIFSRRGFQRAIIRPSKKK